MSKGARASSVVRVPACILVTWIGCANPSHQASPEDIAMTQLDGDETRPSFSPDGQQLAFVHDRGGRRQILLRDAGGGVRRLTEWDDEDAWPSWSPDGGTIAFKTSRDEWEGIWMVDVGGVDPRKLTPDGVTANHPSFSPIGEQIVYISDAAGSQDLYVLSVSGGASRRLTDHPGDEWVPRFSPDGHEAAFYSTWDRNMTDVHVVDVASGELRQLTAHPAEDYRPAWSPNGEWVVFVSSRDDSTDLWAVPAEGGEPVRLTDDAVDRDFPIVAGDGTLAFEVQARRPRVFSVPATGGGATLITNDAIDAYDPVAHPTEEAFVYRAIWGRELNLWIKRAGEPARALRATHDAQYEPVWSRDGTRLAFVENPGGGPMTADVWVIHQDGTEAVRLTTAGGVEALAWCGDVFFLSRDPDATSRHGIWRVATSGGTPTPVLVDAFDNVATDCGPGADAVLFQSDRSGASRLFQLDVDGGVVVEVDTGAGSAAGGRWSPDGRRLAFSSDRDGYDLYVLDLQTGSTVRLTEDASKESWPSWTADGTRVLFSVDPTNVDIGARRLNLPKPH